MFQPVTARPDFVAQEHALLREWAERRTFARLRAQNAGNARWSFLDGPITANNPMGVHHAWGRDVQGPLPALPRDARRGPALPERLRLPGPVGRGQRRARPRVHVASATSRRTASTAFVTPVQAARADLRRAPDRAVDPARACGWTGTTRPSCAGCATCWATDPTAGDDDRGPRRPGDRHGRDARRPAGHARGRRLVLHVQQREQRPHLGLPRRVPPARLAVQGPRHDAVVPALRHGPVARWR